MAVQPAHDIGAVGFGGFDAYAQRDSDLFAALAFGEQFYDFALPRGQRSRRGLAMLGAGFLIQVAMAVRAWNSRAPICEQAGAFGLISLPL
jgi:hypothetical protein